MNNQLFSDYVGITRYAGVPTEQTTGRLHYNENLYGPSPQCMETLNSLTLEDISLYESNEKDELLEALSAETKIPVENLFLNNGSAENIKSILSVFTKRGDTILLPDPGWSYYTGIANTNFSISSCTKSRKAVPNVIMMSLKSKNWLTSTSQK